MQLCVAQVLRKYAIVLTSPAYAVQAAIRWRPQRTGGTVPPCFGLMAAGGSEAAALAGMISSSSAGTARAQLVRLWLGTVVSPSPDDPPWLAGPSRRLPSALDDRIHLLRLEVTGTVCTWLLDGQVLVRLQAAPPGANQRVGLLNQGGQMQVSRFEVIAL